MSDPKYGTDGGQKAYMKTVDENVIEMDDRSNSPNGSTHPIKPLHRAKTMHTADEYFSGPRDTTHHSKWPTFFQLHGSVMPHMILPMFLVGVWAIAFTYIARATVPDHNWSPVLLTVLGFVVGLSLSFRSTTAYARYEEGRKYWAQLTLTSQNLGRVIWIHAKEREGEQGKEDLLAKMTALNLIAAYSISVKHRLRFEPYINYDDLRPYAEYLETFAKEANVGVDITPPKYSKKKRFGEFLGLSWTESNPRKIIKRAQKPLGNLPLEILTYLQSYIDTIIENGTLKTPIFQVQSLTALQSLNDVLTGTDRILTTPLPAAYRIAISQITWLYIILLPPQLFHSLKILTIPATLLAAYIILGIALIGSQIENPFGYDVNDLPLDGFCEQIQEDLTIIMSRPKAEPADFVKRRDNKVLWPVSAAGYQEWAERGESDIRQALGRRVEYTFRRRKAAREGRKVGMMETVHEEV